MQGEGLVQVNVQIQSNMKRINIIDVLKPAEDYVHVGKFISRNYKETFESCRIFVVLQL